jgi:hypothetical protein
LVDLAYNNHKTPNGNEEIRAKDTHDDKETKDSKGNDSKGSPSKEAKPAAAPVPTISVPRKIASLYSLAISDRGDILSAGTSGGFLHVWDLRLGVKPVFKLKGHDDVLKAIVMSPDGSKVQIVR